MADLFDQLAGPVQPRVKAPRPERPSEGSGISSLDWSSVTCSGVLRHRPSRIAPRRLALGAHLQYNDDAQWATSVLGFPSLPSGRGQRVPRRRPVPGRAPHIQQCELPADVFPLLIRLHGIARPLRLSEQRTFVSLVSGAVAVVLVWRLGTALFDEQVGRNAAILFTVFPGMAIAWGLFYSECVGLALVAGCLLLMVRERWVWAGVVGALATATNPAALAPRAGGTRTHHPSAASSASYRGSLPTVVLVPTGFLAYVVWLGVKYHDTLYWWHLNHQAWDTSVDFGRSLLTLLPHFWKLGLPGPAWLEWMGAVRRGGGGHRLGPGQSSGPDQRLLHRCPRSALRERHVRIQASTAHMGVSGPDRGGRRHAAEGVGSRLRWPLPACFRSRSSCTRRWETRSGPLELQWRQPSCTEPVTREDLRSTVTPR